MPVTIRPERPDTPDAAALIEELEEHLAGLYPSESRHGYSVDKLIAQGMRPSKPASIPRRTGG